MTPVATSQEGAKLHTFADLKGVTGGEWNLSEEELDAALYRMTPECEEEIATSQPAEQAAE
jgi:hypothetical protein